MTPRFPEPTQTVLEAVGQHGPTTYRFLLDQLLGLTPGEVRQALSHLQFAGVVERVATSELSPRWVYRLASRPKPDHPQAV